MASRGSVGYIGLYHKGRSVPTSVGSVIYENSIISLGGIPAVEKFVPAGYEHRPDLISNLFFDGPSSWWLVMELNGLSDPFDSLKLGERIMLPNG